MNQNRRAGKLIDKDFQRLRSLMILEHKVKNNSTYAELGKEFNVSEDTVRRSLTFAKRAGLIVKYEDRILEELVPAAIIAIRAALEDGDAQVALEIFKGTVPGFSKTPKTVATNDSSSDLSRYIEQMRAELELGPESNSPRAIEGEILSPDPPATTPDTP